MSRPKRTGTSATWTTPALAGCVFRGIQSPSERTRSATTCQRRLSGSTRLRCWRTWASAPTTSTGCGMLGSWGDRAADPRFTGASLMPIHYAKSDHIAVITLDRYEKRNALDPEHGHALLDCWKRFRDD